MFFNVTGCGNGKYLHINESIFKMGCDVCLPLVDSAWSRGHEVQLCDGLRLPYRDGCFDAVLSIAGNPHHIHSPAKFTVVTLVAQNAFKICFGIRSYTYQCPHFRLGMGLGFRMKVDLGF